MYSLRQKEARNDQDAERARLRLREAEEELAKTTDAFRQRDEHARLAAEMRTMHESSTAALAAAEKKHGEVMLSHAEEIEILVRDKTQLQSELSNLRVAHAEELIRIQRENEAAVEKTQKEVDAEREELHSELGTSLEDLVKSQSVTSKLEAELKEANERSLVSEKEVRKELKQICPYLVKSVVFTYLILHICTQ